LQAFWDPFKAQVDDKEANVSRKEALQARVIGSHPVTGKEISVRMGRFGPFVQFGSTEEEEKPLFYSLRAGQRIDTLTLEEALDLSKLPRALGEGPDGYPLTANIGRFGPYVRYGEKSYVSLTKEDDPHTVTLERAMELLRLKEEGAAARLIKAFAGTTLQLLNGRYGPYLTDGTKNARLPKDRDPASLTLAECEKLLALAPPPKPRGKKKGAAAKKATTKKAASAEGAVKKTPANPSTSSGRTASTKATVKKATTQKTATKKVTAKKAATKKKTT
jgi:DNA topoisomerase-1